MNVSNQQKQFAMQQKAVFTGRSIQVGIYCSALLTDFYTAGL
jgi:hypothetical protein